MSINWIGAAMVALFLRNCHIDLNVVCSTLYSDQYVETPQHPWQMNGHRKCLYTQYAQLNFKYERNTVKFVNLKACITLCKIGHRYREKNVHDFSYK